MASPLFPDPRGHAAQLYPYASVSSEARKLSAEAQSELAHASQAAQRKAGPIPLYSAKYYAACTLGGLFACGLTHAAVTPLDLIKCRRQVNASLYPSNLQALLTITRTAGLRGLFTGWSPTLFGYSAQGALKYGGYEFFKKTFSDAVGDPATAARYSTGIYLAASASAEFLADVALCPWEAVKVRMQTAEHSPYRGAVHGVRSVLRAEGVAGLYKGLYPLWGRQIPYTMMKFASFEKVVEAIYTKLPGRKDDYGKGAQAAVAFTGGYIAGILCAVVSHPADVMVSKLNSGGRKAGEGIGTAVGRMYGQIGFAGLWNGLPMRIVMVGTLTGMQWLLYDGFKIFFGLPTTGGVEEKHDE
ncbi:mitochondrial phosphate carrier protein [Morchella snyderi]|nr:mitochondrial phosphate carrier protein [Morchella snyderi]